MALSEAFRRLNSFSRNIDMVWIRIGHAYRHLQRRFSALTISADDLSCITAVSKSSAVSLDTIRSKKGFIIDMDGVIYHGKSLLKGASEFVEYLHDNGKKFLFLTNASERSPKELQEKLGRMGIQVEEGNFYTSALATASFMKKSSPNGGSAYVIGEPGLISALYNAGFTMNDHNPDWVVVGETRNYSYEKIEHAAHLVRNGARLLGTNCDTKDRLGSSFIPGCAALIKPIEMVAEVDAYFVGKPNPMIMRTALQQLGVKRSETVVIGDRMDTDVLGGLQADITTTLVLTGVTKCSDLKRFAYRPDVIAPSIGHIVPGFYPD